jgi:hypothetical protein
MPGLVPGIHVLRGNSKDVDGRDKPGHDETAKGATERAIPRKESRLGLWIPGSTLRVAPE